MTTKRLFITAFLLTLMLLPVSAIAQEYHLLILAPYDFVDELLPLKYWKDETGRPTTIVTLGEIEEKEYRRTKDQPERIKRCIEEYVRNHNVQYVLIAGDSDKLIIARQIFTIWTSMMLLVILTTGTVTVTIL